MPRRNRVREQALAEAKKAHRYAGQKVSRLERSGIHVKDAGLDPRVDMDKVNSMGTREARAYTKQLSQFNSRETGFVPGINGQPISRQSWRAYVREQTRFNAKANAFESSIGNARIPTSGGLSELGQTIAQRQAAVEASDLARAGQSNRVFTTYDKKSTEFFNEASLNAQTENLARKNKADYMHTAIERRMNSMRALLMTNPGMTGFIEQLEGLEDDALLVVMEYSPFARIAETAVYPESDEYQQRDAAHFAKTGERFIDQTQRDLQTVLDWAVDVANGKADRNSRPGSSRAKGRRKN